MLLLIKVEMFFINIFDVIRIKLGVSSLLHENICSTFLVHGFVLIETILIISL